MQNNQQKTGSDAVVEIAGAGIAGLTAAIILARAGRQVVVHEAQKGVGYRFGGDFQGLENWTTREDVLQSLESLGLATDFTAFPCRNGTAFDPDGNRYEINSREPLFYLVERGPGPGTLDDALLRQARSQVLRQGDKSGSSVPVVFRGKAQCAGNGLSPCQTLQRGSGTPQERPKGWSVSVHGCVPPLAKGYGHSLRGVPCPER